MIRFIDIGHSIIRRPLHYATSFTQSCIPDNIVSQLAMLPTIEHFHNLISIQASRRKSFKFIAVIAMITKSETNFSTNCVKQAINLFGTIIDDIERSGNVDAGYSIVIMHQQLLISRPECGQLQIGQGLCEAGSTKSSCDR